MRLVLPALILALVAGCHPAGPDGPVTVSVIGERTEPASIGLVQFDAHGQIVPALALRWAILEGGRDYLFRIDDTPGQPPARAVARRLRPALTAHRPRREAIPVEAASIEAVTPTVVELRVATPQPDLLALLAGPDLALFRPAHPAPVPAVGHAIPLHPASDGPGVLVRGERVGRAVARFRAGRADLVTGGTFADLPVALVAGLDERQLRFDPATGLFGFALAEDSVYADPALLRALGLALDRDRLVEAIGAPGLTTVNSLAGAGPDYPLAARVGEAQALLAGRALPPLRVAMPAGPGARLLFALAARDWRRIGVNAVAVAASAPADLVLIDRVVPPASLAFAACAVSAGCDIHDPAALAAPPFLPLTSPVRWSLVAPRLEGFSPNPLAAHPLAGLTRRR